MIKIEGPLTKKTSSGLKAGQEVLYTGEVIAARDQAHKRITAALSSKKKIPFNLKDAVIYYVGPTPGRTKGRLGSAGPTTSSRMDAFTPALLRSGLTGMIGKGNRSSEVVRAMKKYGAVYFAAIGGAAAYLGKRIEKAEVIAYPELGAEAVRRLYVRDFPLIVAIDSRGRNAYKT